MASQNLFLGLQDIENFEGSISMPLTNTFFQRAYHDLLHQGIFHPDENLEVVHWT